MPKSTNPFTDETRHVFLRLPPFTEEGHVCETDFERWIYVFKNTAVLGRLPFKAEKSVFIKLEEIVDIAAPSKGYRMKYDESIKVFRDNIVTEAYAKRRRAHGREIRYCKKLKAAGIQAAVTSQATGLNADGVAALLRMRMQRFQKIRTKL